MGPALDPQARLGAIEGLQDHAQQDRLHLGTGSRDDSLTGGQIEGLVAGGDGDARVEEGGPAVEQRQQGFEQVGQVPRDPRGRTRSPGGSPPKHEIFHILTTFTTRLSGTC